MAVSFIRVDDRMIHGQTCTRWALEYPCDGLIAVNNAAAGNSVLKAAYKSASGKKTFVWSLDEFKEKSQKVLASKDNYFLITKNPLDMEKILVGQGFQPGIKEVGFKQEVRYGNQLDTGDNFGFVCMFGKYAGVRGNFHR